MERYSDYDSFAWVYNRHWGDFVEGILPSLERLLLRYLAEEAHILDLCCGAGHLAQRLLERGYRVTGVDGSSELLRFARGNAPAATFILADAREFDLTEPVAAAVSTYDSLNHIMSLDQLVTVFRHVYAVLVDGGRYVFDMNMESGYVERWNGSFGIVEEDHVVAGRSGHDLEVKRAWLDLTMFFPGVGGWDRTDLRLTQSWYTVGEICGGLEAAGFRGVEAIDPREREQRKGEPGRMFFTGQK